MGRVKGESKGYSRVEEVSKYLKADEMSQLLSFRAFNDKFDTRSLSWNEYTGFFSYYYLLLLLSVSLRTRSHFIYVKLKVNMELVYLR